MSSPSERYEILEAFGKPTEHAIVGRGRDLVTGIEYAVKMRRGEGNVERRFTREVEAMRSAAGPHVMSVLDVDPDGEWYTMPIAAGELTPAIKNLSQNEREELALAVVRAVADGLHSFHVEGRVHRDLKPQNILWLEDEGGARWVVSDFGIARNAPGTTTADLTRKGNLVGTERWAAPEQHADAHSATPRTDVYSVGAIVGWIMTGELPTPVHVPLPTTRFRTVVTRATRKSPAQRYPTVDEMLEAMERELDGDRGPLSTQLEQILSGPFEVETLNDFALAHRDNGALFLPELHRIKRSTFISWFDADPDGLEQFAESMCDLLTGGQDAGGLEREGLRPPLFWLLDVLRHLVHKQRLDLAEPLARALFAAAESCNQFPVGDSVASWLNSLSHEASAQAMLSAVVASSTESYIRSILENDWSKPSSTTLRRWML
ncbi:serine/threonine-protein kinase [Cryobacterium sp. PH31-AA6]|uniref:serine/threonine-protein kinase n=1 Tax=Cryobacterium sp. PH31-AA6 TaxID=3046205 RepID=UPI0024BB9EA6|nr:serine/threonine-protein kinase [Cryobacterium sp. PH31-AA6]MDJ0324204.1 serine/threonine-protein kinase [Cryobacterium sp. PH31-AA6]